jgi:hypothetical protein
MWSLVCQSAFSPARHLYSLIDAFAPVRLVAGGGGGGRSDRVQLLKRKLCSALSACVLRARQQESAVETLKGIF